MSDLAKMLMEQILENMLDEARERGRDTGKLHVIKSSGGWGKQKFSAHPDSVQAMKDLKPMLSKHAEVPTNSSETSVHARHSNTDYHLKFHGGDWGSHKFPVSSEHKVQHWVATNKKTGEKTKITSHFKQKWPPSDKDEDLNHHHFEPYHE